MSVVKDVPIKQIKVVENHRTNIDKTELHELMESIKQHGLKQPIGVAEHKRGGYVLLFGHRRMLACQKLGHNTIRASVESEVSNEKMLIINLTENMQRKDPSFAELGRIIAKLETMKLTTKEIAARLGIPENKIRTVVSVYNGLPSKFRSRVTFMEKGGGRKARRGMIPADVATKIVSLKKDHGLKDKAVEDIFTHVAENGADKLDLQNLGIMMNQGVSAADAMKRMDEYAVYTFDFVASKQEVNALMANNSIFKRQNVFKRIMYGELPALKRPAFLAHEIKNLPKPVKVKPTVQDNGRYEEMRKKLVVRARIGNLTEDQARALKSTEKIKPREWTPEQCRQLENIFSASN